MAGFTPFTICSLGCCYLLLRYDIHVAQKLRVILTLRRPGSTPFGGCGLLSSVTPATLEPLLYRHPVEQEHRGVRAPLHPGPLSVGVHEHPKGAEIAALPGAVIKVRQNTRKAGQIDNAFLDTL